MKLNPSHSFSHNLCFKSLNGKCDPILDIYSSRTFLKFKKTPQFGQGLVIQIVFQKFETLKNSNYLEV